MIEKVINLENVHLVDFLGVDNALVDELGAAFPNSKIVSRGDELKIKGAAPEIFRINDVINGLLEHYRRFGKVTKDNVISYLQQEHVPLLEEAAQDNILFGLGGTPIRPKTINQQKLVYSAQSNDLVFALGPAGTGKTYISVALAVAALKNKEVKRIIITRPAVEAGENLGFLPGDLREKIDPYLRPIHDALTDMIQRDKLRYYQENGTIEIAPLAYMRGRTLRDAFILLDEAQNTTPMQMKMFLTRMGPDSKMIITGDRSQIDLKKGQRSGLEDALSVLAGVPGIGTVTLDDTDVVRHKLVRRIVAAYDKAQSRGDQPAS